MLLSLEMVGNGDAAEQNAPAAIGAAPPARSRGDCPRRQLDHGIAIEPIVCSGPPLAHIEARRRSPARGGPPRHWDNPSPASRCTSRPMSEQTNRSKPRAKRQGIGKQQNRIERLGADAQFHSTTGWKIVHCKRFRQNWNETSSLSNLSSPPRKRGPGQATEIPGFPLSRERRKRGFTCKKPIRVQPRYAGTTAFLQVTASFGFVSSRALDEIGSIEKRVVHKAIRSHWDWRRRRRQ